MTMTVVVAYDVSADNRRARLAAMLQASGDRIQKSLFLLSVDEDRLAEVREHALEIIDADTDSVYFFRQCGDCWEALGCVGQAQSPEPTFFWLVQ